MLTQRLCAFLIITTTLCFSCVFADMSAWKLVTNPQTDKTPFHFQNNIINPRCIAEFMSKSKEAQPVVTSVDLDSCQYKHGRFYSNQADDYLFYQNKAHERFFSYRVIGQARNGLFAILASDHRNKTKTLSQIQLIKFGKNFSYDYRSPTIARGDKPVKQLNILTRHLIELQGQISSGEACDFKIASAAVSGNTLEVNFDFPKALLATLEKQYQAKPQPTASKVSPCFGQIEFTYDLQNLSEPTFVALKTPAMPVAPGEKNDKT